MNSNASQAEFICSSGLWWLGPPDAPGFCIAVASMLMRAPPGTREPLWVIAANAPKLDPIFPPLRFKKVHFLLVKSLHIHF